MELSPKQQVIYLRSAVRILTRRAFDAGIRDSHLHYEDYEAILEHFVDMAAKQCSRRIDIPRKAVRLAVAAYPHLVG